VEIKSGLNSEKTCYRSGQNILSSRPLSSNLKIKISKIILLPIVGYETWSFVPGGEGVEEHDVEEHDVEENI
jgi:hypothetical protein